MPADEGSDTICGDIFMDNEDINMEAGAVLPGCVKRYWGSEIAGKGN